MKNLTDHYAWQLSFASGVVISQLENNRKPKEARIRQNSPPEHLGRPLAIKMLPQRANLPEVTIAIPEGALPYYGMRTVLNGVTPTGRAIVVGFRQGDFRYLQMIDPNSGASVALPPERV